MGSPVRYSWRALARGVGVTLMMLVGSVGWVMLGGVQGAWIIMPETVVYHVALPVVGQLALPRAVVGVLGIALSCSIAAGIADVVETGDGPGGEVA